MTTPDRQSLYPAPYQGDGWQASKPKRRSRLWVIPVVLVAVALVALATVLGTAVGHKIGTSDVTVTDRTGQTINSLQVGVGTCLTKLPGDGDVAQVTAVPCSVRHVAEAVAQYTFRGDEWPGRDEVTSTVLDFCGARIQPGLAGSSEFQATDWDAGLRWVAWIPTEASWGIGERTGVCVVYRDDGIRGSFVADNATFVD